MKFGLFGKGEPALTKKARSLSDAIEALSVEDQERASQVIQAILYGMQNLGAMPEQISSILWDIMLTLGRKLLIGSSDQKAEAVIAKLKAGLSDRTIELLWPKK